MRLKLPGAQANFSLLEQIKQSLSPQPGIKRVDASVTSGSIIIQYDPARYDEFHHDLTRYAENTQLFGLEPPASAKIALRVVDSETEKKGMAEQTETARVLTSHLEQFNEAIKEATHKIIDLKVLFPLGLALLSVGGIGVDASTPLWVTLGFFSFSSYGALHSMKRGDGVEIQ